ncbi:MAG: sulfotransferase family protein [Reichenbachiella sp.]
MVINLIATPRNVSTAIMYSFAQHSLVKVMDEPFYAYYLELTNLDHPGREEVLKELPRELNSVFDLIDSVQKKYSIVFIKNMAHHLAQVSNNELSNFRNIFLTRDPGQLISSFSKVIKHPTMQDIGVKAQWNRFEAMKNDGLDPVIIDSGILLNHPKEFLMMLCEKLGISFESSMLQWSAGPIPEDGSWAKYWYGSVHISTKFTKPQKKEVHIPNHCKELYDEALVYYEKLAEHSLTI